MIKRLFVQNFSLIDQVDIDFENGLTVITGETGAGKSILVGALSLILGERLNHSSLKDQTKKCIVEGKIDLSDYQLKQFFDENDIDYEPLTIIRREITPQGKSRSFINDSPVTLDIMKSLGNELIDIHSQHQSLQINDQSFQIDVLDAIAGNKELTNKYRKNFQEFKRIEKELNAKHESLEEARKKEDYINFQLEELLALNLELGEVEQLESEQRFFSNSEEVIRNLSRLNHILKESDENAISQLQAVRSILSGLEDYISEFKELSLRFNSTLIELEDISNEVEQQADSFQYDPERHAIVEERLAEIHRLQVKHQLPYPEDLVQLKEDLNQQLESISTDSEEVKKLRLQKEKLENELLVEANEISKKRLSICESLSSNIEQLVKELGILNVVFQVEHVELESFNSFGKDEFNFLFSANKGVQPQKIAQTASGGEISRLMLAIKSIVANYKLLPTVLFDEIDTGVSGEVADKMGEILSKMGTNRQVISITHLPQIAAKGKTHYFVFKEDEGNVSKTNLKKLSEEERVVEIAKMLSGKKMSEAAINNAKELLA